MSDREDTAGLAGDLDLERQPILDVTEGGAEPGLHEAISRSKDEMKMDCSHPPSLADKWRSTNENGATLSGCATVEIGSGPIAS